MSVSRLQRESDQELSRMVTGADVLMLVALTVILVTAGVRLLSLLFAG